MSPDERPSEVSPSSPDDAAFVRYLLGEATPEEQWAIEAWLETDPGRPLAFAAFRQGLGAPNGEREREVRVRGALGGALRARIDMDRPGTSTPAAQGRGERAVAGMARYFQKGRRGLGEGTLRGYASLTMFGTALVASMVVLMFAKHTHTPSSLVSMRDHVYATTVGQCAIVTLRDGSRVTLAPQTRLVVVDGFRAIPRHLVLDGEAYFEVRAHAGGPFIVHTGMATTRVLGTQFDVRQYAYDGRVRVAVLSGKVAVAGAQGFTTLSAGRVAFVADSGVSSTAADVPTLLSWTEGRLVFANVPVAAVLAAVGRWYGYRFQLADSVLARERVTTTLDVHAREATLSAISVLLDATLSVQDTVVTVSPRTTHRASPRSRTSHDLMNLSQEVGK